MTLSVQEKVREFRDKAHRSKLLATVTQEQVAKKIYEDAARQWDDLAEKLEKTGVDVVLVVPEGTNPKYKNSTEYLIDRLLK